MAADDLVTIEQLRKAKSDLALIANIANGPNGQFASRFGESIPSLQRVMDTILAEGLGGVTQNREVVNTLAALQALQRDPETREVIMLGRSAPGDGGGEIWFLDADDETPADKYPLRVESNNGDIWRPLRTGGERSVNPTKFANNFAETEEFADLVGRKIFFDDLTNVSAPIVVTKDIEIDLGGKNYNVNQMIGSNETIDSLFDIQNGASLKLTNGSFEVSNKVTRSIVEVREGCTFISEGVNYTSTGASDIPTNNTPGIRCWDVTNARIEIRDSEIKNVPLPIACRGGFSLHMENLDIEGYSRAIHELLSSETLSPRYIYGRNIYAYGVKPNATKFGFQINRQNGPRVSCRPTYINCEVVGNTHANGDPVTWEGGLNPNNGHADMWPWQGVDGGTRINCGCRNGGDSGESMTRTTSNIVNVNCFAYNIEGQGVNCGSAVSQISMNPATLANFNNGDPVVIGAIGVATITNIEDNVLTLGSPTPSVLLTNSTADELSVVRGFTDPDNNSTAHQSNIVSITANTVTVENAGDFQVGNFVGLGPETSVGRFERTFNFDNRIALIGSLVYQTPRAGQQIRSATVVGTLTDSVTGENNSWLGGEYADNGRNIDGQNASFGNFFINLHDNAKIINVKHGPAPHGVIATRSQNCRVDCDLSAPDIGILRLGGASVFHMQSVVTHNDGGSQVQLEAAIRPTRLGNAGLPAPEDTLPGVIFYQVNDNKLIQRDNQVRYVDLLGNPKQGDFWPHQGGIQLPVRGTAARPDIADLENGFTIWDSTLNKMITKIGAVWRDATGAIV